jgi:hypothetical protein
MDIDIEVRFRRVMAELEKTFGEGLDVQSILFLIGVNELGEGHRTFNKNEKTDLLHVAVCTLLEPYGFYEFEGVDEDNWPHFKLNKQLPSLGHMEQQHLIKEAIIEYFEKNEYIAVGNS